MTASGFDREAAYSVFEGLRPSADQMLDRAAFATYSLDLVAVAALILSLSRAGEQELEAEIAQLKMENAFLKKLNALVQARKRQQKKS